MQHTQPEVHHITNIIKVMKGGIDFYNDAKLRIPEQRTQNLFDKMIAEKQAAIAQLQRFAIQQTGDIEEHNAFLIEARQIYTRLLDKIHSDSTKHTFMTQLEKVEDKVLEEIDLALERRQPAECEATLHIVRSNMRECHSEMKALQYVEQRT